MPQFKLPSGRRAFVSVKHDEAIFDGDGRQVNLDTRGTKVDFEVLGRRTLFTARVRCVRPDNFSKAEGRKQVAIKLLRQLAASKRLRFDKQDRRAVFMAICPEYPQR